MNAKHKIILRSIYLNCLFLYSCSILNSLLLSHISQSIMVIFLFLWPTLLFICPSFYLSAFLHSSLVPRSLTIIFSLVLWRQGGFSQWKALGRGEREGGEGAHISMVPISLYWRPHVYQGTPSSRIQLWSSTCLFMSSEDLSGLPMPTSCLLANIQPLEWNREWLALWKYQQCWKGCLFCSLCWEL